MPKPKWGLVEPVSLATVEKANLFRAGPCGANVYENKQNRGFRAIITSI